MNKNKYLLAICLIINLQIFGLDDYTSTHEETYWFPERDFDLPPGIYQGSVRSNLNWGERLSFYINDDDCGANKQVVDLTLWSNESEIIKENNPNFKLESLIDLPLTLNATMDNGLSKIIVGFIESVFVGQKGQDVYVIYFPEMPSIFYQPPAKIMSLSVRKDDPLAKYFDGKERQYRMEGLIPVWFQLTSECINRINSVEAQQDLN
jgi:hypothetical protein